jgi:hypothetical protein
VSDEILRFDWGKTLDFMIGGSALPHCVSGWGEPEVGLIWTDGLNARLIFTVEPPASNIALALNCYPFLGEGKIPFQELHLYVNFLRVGFATLKAPQELVFTVPRHVFSQRTLYIDLYLPKAVSPSFLRLGQDIRQLGISVTHLTMSEQREPAVADRRPARP